MIVRGGHFEHPHNAARGTERYSVPRVSAGVGRFHAIHLRRNLGIRLILDACRQPAPEAR